ncbi:hypothetical protein [Oceanobacillus profundus]|nr:hypothetical protein [Oceanobacillus profundus]MBR2246285.1 guanylate kinase [Bacilli bacterium]MBR3119694.1 guanylate kinase [Oceanobacillus sp.]
MQNHSNKLFCLIGPSSSGKDAIKFASGYPYVVSYRTRKKRVGEIEGKDGYFIDVEGFHEIESELIAKTYYCGNYYGVTKKELDRLSSSHMIYVIDWEGYQYMKAMISKEDLPIDMVSIYININPNDLKERMIKQNRTETEIEERLQQLDQDISVKSKCKYIINNKTTLENAVKQLNKIIQLEELQ